MLNFYKEYSFSVRGRNLQAQSWGDPSAKPVIALHGWLDNSGSFTPLTEQLENIFLVCLDMAGHGRSDHRSLDSAYNIWQDVADILEVTEQLGWRKFSLLGHSRGGICAVLTAGTFPKRVESLLLLDALIPIDIAKQDPSPRQLAKAILSSRRLAKQTSSVYPSWQKALEPRNRSQLPLSTKAGKYLTDRGLLKVEGGFIWSTDSRLMAPSEIRLTESQYQAFLAEICCPSLVLIADHSFLRNQHMHNFDRLLGDSVFFKRTLVAGRHHAHMEEETLPAIAEKINSFFSGNL